ncbi:MAG: P-loop NTPase [Rhodospirillaceae bacterium]
MASLRVDQAEGLRQLLASESLRVVAVASATAGAGKTSIVSNLATTFAAAGREVLILDAVQGAPMSAIFGVTPRFDLQDVIERKRPLEQALIPCAQGVRMLPIARGLRGLGRLADGEQARVIESFQWLACPVDVVLIDTPSDTKAALLCAGFAAHETLLVLSRTTSSITANYALLKTLRMQYAMRRFRVLVNKAGNEAEARAIYGNMAAAARQYLGSTVDYAGYIPRDDKLHRATLLGLPLIDAFPMSPAAVRMRELADLLLRRQPAQAGEGMEHFVQRLIRSSRLQAVSAAA